MQYKLVILLANINPCPAEQGKNISKKLILKTTKKYEKLHHASICQPVEVNVTYCESRHEISNNVVCATSKATDQPAHTRSLIRAFASPLNIL